jgi:hypothetical protein
MTSALDSHLANAILGIDTLWGGDVMNPSGVGRFIADSWFSDEPLPPAYTDKSALKVRDSGGVSAKEPDRKAIEAYLKKVDVHGAILEVAAQGKKLKGLRGAYLLGLAECFEVMWDLAMEILEKGEPVPYDRCVRTLTGKAPEPSDPISKKQLLKDLLASAGHGDEGLRKGVDAWRKARLVPSKSIPALGAAFIAQYDALSDRNLAPYLPKAFLDVPRANVSFLPIENAWFSGSMNYLGRARKADGTPEYESTYELNAALQISIPEFQQLVSHEVVPGHVTTFAYLQNLYVRKKVGLEASILTMNTRPAALFEGIANNGILIAYGVTEIHQLPDRDLQIGLLLALLQDDAKNHSSYLTWGEHVKQKEVAKTLRKEFLVSEERADKLSGAWGRHPLLGRMYLPAYRFGTDLVARLRRQYPAEKVLPALYGCNGVVDALTIEQTLI